MLFLVHRRALRSEPSWRALIQLALSLHNRNHDLRMYALPSASDVRSSFFVVPPTLSSVVEEIDQVFSRVGVALRQTDAATRTILGKHIVGSYKKNVSSFPVRITHLYNCGNVRDLLQGNMFSVPSVTTPQAFRVSRDPADNNVKLQVQARGYENKWAAIDRYITTLHSTSNCKLDASHPAV